MAMDNINRLMPPGYFAPPTSKSASTLLAKPITCRWFVGKRTLPYISYRLTGATPPFRVFKTWEAKELAHGETRK
jgi:hypothetical protein